MIWQWFPALTAYDTAWAASRTWTDPTQVHITAAAARRHIRHRQANAGPCLPFPCLLPCQPPLTAWGKCMQVLGTQSNLPTLLLSISLAPCSLGRIHCRRMTTPSRASRRTTTCEQHDADGTCLLSLSGMPARYRKTRHSRRFCYWCANFSLTFLARRHFSHRGPPVPKSYYSKTPNQYPSSVTSQNPVLQTAPTSAAPGLRGHASAPVKQPSWSIFYSFSFLSFLILLGWD